MKKRKKSFDMRRRSETFKVAFLDAYLVAVDDTDIGRIIKRSQSTVCKYRMGLNFPPPSKVTADERKKLVDEWKRKEK